MRRRLTIVASWLAATCAATVLVASGVGTIRDAARRDAALATPAAAATTGGPRAPSGSRFGVPEMTEVGLPSTSTVVATATIPPTTAAGSTPRPTVATTTVATTTVPVATANTPPGTASPPPTSITITISSTGGTITVRSSASSVVVVVSTPNPGFTTRIDQRGTTAVRVEFESSSHRSRIEAWWEGGPRQDVREDS